MKLSKSELKNLQNLRKELHLLGRRSEINELSTRLQVREKLPGIEAVHQATLEVAAVAVRDGEMSASLLPGAATPKAGRPVKRTPLPVAKATPAKPKSDYYLLPGGSIGSKPKSSGVKDYVAIRAARTALAASKKILKAATVVVFHKKADSLWSEYAGLGTRARVNFFNLHRSEMQRN